MIQLLCLIPSPLNFNLIDNLRPTQTEVYASIVDTAITSAALNFTDLYLITILDSNLCADGVAIAFSSDQRYL